MRADLGRSRLWLLLVGLVFAGCKERAAPVVTVDAAPVAVVDAAVVKPAAAAAYAVPGAAEVASAKRGMVVSDAPLATQVGAAVLAGGGNAVDAAVATALALAVVYPEAGNVAGGGFAVVRGKDGKVAALDFREVAPAAAKADMFKDAPKDSLESARAAGVPGSVAGLWALHKKYGTKKWKDLVAPAVKLAAEGFVVDARLAASVKKDAEGLAKWPASAALFLPEGKPLAEGSTWRNGELAAVLKRIAEQGEKGFYRGETAKLLVAEMQRSGGLVSAADLQKYKVVWREPIAFEYRGKQVFSMPPPSSGGLVLAMVARMLAQDDLAALGWHSAAHVHLLTEGWRRAYAARNAYLGDPDFVKVPLEMLLDTAHAQTLRASITPLRATPSVEAPFAPEGLHTTHLAVVDERGMAVSLTTTLNALYGNKQVVTGLGFLLNNEMDDFTTQPGQPNMFGLVQGPANEIAPGKRMLSSMAPTIVVDEKGPVLLVGGRGGSRIPTAVWQVLSNVLDFGMDVGRAVAEPRVHHQHMPDVLFWEAGALEAAVSAALEGYGHALKGADGPLAAAPAIVRVAEGWQGAADPRKGGAAAGY